MKRLGLSLALIVLGCGRPPDSGAFRPIEIGEPVPFYAVRTLAGDSIRIGTAGQPVTLLNVWATWCTECEEEMADLVALQRELGHSGARTLGVSVDVGHESRVHRFAEQQGLNFHVAIDREQRVRRLFRVVGVPTTYVIAQDGRLLWQHVGNLHPVRDSVAAVIRGALGQAREGEPR